MTYSSDAIARSSGTERSNLHTIKNNQNGRTVGEGKENKSDLIRKHAVQGKEAPVFPIRIVWIEAHGRSSVEIASLDAEFPGVAGAAHALHTPLYI